jgi:hypothetical protein
VRIFALAITLAAACRHAPVVEPVADRDDDDLPDDVDRCPEIIDRCALDAGDDDGCPDVPTPPRVHVPLRHDDRELLARISGEVPELRDGVSVMVVGYALPNEAPGLALERATAIALRLEEDGVPLDRLLARGAAPLVPFDPAPGATVDITTTGCPGAATGSSASR